MSAKVTNAVKTLGLLVFLLAAGVQSANAGIIELNFSGTNQSGLPDSVPAPFTATIRLNTETDVPDDNPQAGAARFVSAWITSLPPYAPPEQNTVIRSVFPDLVLSTRVSVVGGVSNPQANQLQIGPGQTPMDMVISFADGQDSDSLSISLRSSGFFPPSSSWSLSLSVSGLSDALFPGTGSLTENLLALDGFAGRELNIAGTGFAAEGRASPLNGWSLDIQSLTVTAVGEPLQALLLLAGLVLLFRRAGSPVVPGECLNQRA